MSNSREQIDRLLKQIEQEAYARGWAAAIAALQAKAPGLPNAESPQFKSEHPSNGSEPVQRGRGRPATSIGRVRTAIFEKPGMRGVEIVTYLKEKGTPVHERTLRSCLRRLKGRDADMRRKRWYPRLPTEHSVEVPARSS